MKDIESENVCETHYRFDTYNAFFNIVWSKILIAGTMKLNSRGVSLETVENTKVSDSLCASTLRDNGYLLESDKILSDLANENTEVSHSLHDSTLRDVTISDNNIYLLETDKTKILKFQTFSMIVY